MTTQHSTILYMDLLNIKIQHLKIENGNSPDEYIVMLIACISQS